jgi:hypothetical protein
MHVFGIHDWKGEPGYCTSSTTAKRVRFCSFLCVRACSQCDFKCSFLCA